MGNQVNFALTVGDIRRALDGHSDEEPLVAQVIAVDNTGWEMNLSFSPAMQLSPDRPASGIFVHMTHPDLTSVVDDDRSISSLRLKTN
jgi:hypothetical protein